MASLINRGRKFSVRFTAPDGNRRTIAAGTTSKSKAENLAKKIDALIGLSRNGIDPLHDPQLASWLHSLGDATRKRLERVGLIKEAHRGSEEVLLCPELDALLERRRRTCKQSTILNVEHAVRNLKAFFGNVPIRSIRARGALDFQDYLLKNEALTTRSTKHKEQLSEATRRKRLSNARMIFEEFVTRELIESNPFKSKGIETTAVPNRERDYFVTIEETQRILDVCPTQEWQLVILLMRFGAIRPCELLPIRVSDVDLKRQRVRIFSPKTERYKGKAVRWIPIFPELQVALKTAVALSLSQDEYLVKVHRHTTAGYHARIKRLVKRAGLKLWTKLLQNIRATRATELEKERGGLVASMWAGHSEVVARTNYWQVRDCDYELATQGTSSIRVSETPALVATLSGDVATLVASTTLQDIAVCEDLRNPRVEQGVELQEFAYLGNENGPERT
jgi:integrase